MILESCVKIEYVMEDSQLIVFIDTLVDKFFDKEAKRSQSDIHIG